MKRTAPPKRPTQQPRRQLPPRRRETDAVLEHAKELPPARQHAIAPTSESAYWFDYD